MKIILVALYDYHSIGVRGLHSFLEAKGYEVESMYFKFSSYVDGLYTRDEVENAVKWLESRNPDFIGFGIRSPLFPLFEELSCLIRKRMPKCMLIVGGAHAVADPLGCLRLADYVVTGDGETGLLEVLNSGPHRIIHGQPVSDLDSLPFPYYGLNGHFYGRMRKSTKLSYNTSRGCFFKCSYCQESLSKAPRRRKSVGKVVEDIRKFSEIYPDVKLFTFGDSIFTNDDDWLKSFGDAFIGSPFEFWCSGYADMMDCDTLALLQRAGFSSIRIGVQSGSEEIRRLVFNRKDSLDKIHELAWEAHRIGMVVHYDFIVENPYDTPATMAATRNFIKRLPPSAAINKFELRYWPGTPLTNRALAEGHIQADDIADRSVRVGDWSYIYQQRSESNACTASSSV